MAHPFSKLYVHCSQRISVLFLFAITAAGGGPKKSPRIIILCTRYHSPFKKVQVGNDQEMAQSERNSHSINRGVGKKLKWHLGTYTKKAYRKPSEQLFPNWRPLTRTELKM